MPYLISREQAMDQINRQIPRGECLICHLAEKREKYILHKDKHVSVLLSLFPRTWGQVMVLLNKHQTSFTEMDTASWQEMSTLLLKTTRTVESVLRPLRCYVASTGSTNQYPMTSPHLHFNVIPVYNETDKPTTIFTWEQGLFAAPENEWDELFEKLKRKFDAI